MTKKLQTQKKNVDVVNQDDLALFQDSELDSRASFLFDEMRRRGIPQQSPGAAQYEIELAYVQREQQIRMKRRTAHRAYLNSQDDGYVDESYLPEFRATPPPWYWQN